MKTNYLGKSLLASRLFALLIGLAVVIPISAEEYELWAVGKDATSQTLGLSKLCCITFELEGTSSISQVAYLVTKHTDGTIYRYDMQTLDYLYFGVGISTPIGKMEWSPNKVILHVSEDILTVGGATGKATLLDHNGLILSTHSLDDTNTLMIKHLAKGFYILKIGNHAYKFMK